MVHSRLVVVIVLVTVAAPVGVGAAAPDTPASGPAAVPSTPIGDNTTAAQSLGQSISGMMQASLAQTAGTVENGMWVAAYANTSKPSEKRALVTRRTTRINQSLTELRDQRGELQAAFRNGTIDRTTYLARLSTIVGRLASLSKGIEETTDRGAAVGVNQSRLQELRSQARNFSGPAVSRLARNLTGGPGPGQAGLFDPGPPDNAGQPGSANGSDRGSGNHGAGNQSGNASDNSERGDNARSGGANNASNGTAGGNETGKSGNASSGSDTDRGQDGSQGNASSGNGGGSDSNSNRSLTGHAGQASVTDAGDRAVREAVGHAATA